MKCPKCDNVTSFRAVLLSVVVESVQITLDPISGEVDDWSTSHKDTENDAFPPECDALCNECGYEGLVGEFLKDDPERQPSTLGEFEFVPQGQPKRAEIHAALKWLAEFTCLGDFDKKDPAIAKVWAVLKGIQS
jgi:hypothetical protein